MFEKLLKMEENYEAISERLTNPETIADTKLYAQLMKEYKNLSPIIEKFRELKKAKDELNSIKVAAENLYESLQKLDENISIKPLKKLFNLVSKKIEPFVGKNNLEIGLATVNWCIEYNLFQQGYTALEETIKTLLCIKLNLPDDPNSKDSSVNLYENREDIVNKILTEAAIKLQNKDNKSDVQKLIEDCSDKLASTKEFCKLSQTVKSFRNDINHFGFNRDGAKNYKTISDNLKLHYSELLKFIDGDFPWYPVENTSEENLQSEVAADSSQV